MKIPNCPICDGPGFLLGLLRWFRCRNCGMDFNRRRRVPKKGGTPQVTRS